ncbi:MAG: hypothetical protein RR332_01180, partial [Clostridiales bacterium]
NEPKQRASSPFSDAFAQMFGGGTGQPFPPQNNHHSGGALDKTNLNRLLSLAAGPVKVLGVLLFLAVGFHFYLKHLFRVIIFSYF